MTIQIHTTKDKNFGLSEKDFQQMVSALKKEDHSLFEKTFLAHFKACVNYLQRHCRANPEDAYDATMDAYMLFCKRLKAGKIKYGNLRYLFTQIAVQFHYSWAKKNKKMISIEGIDLSDEVHRRYDQGTRETLSLAWNELGSKCRTLLGDLYYNEISSKKLAAITGRSDAAIRKQKQRCMEKLKSIFKKYDK